MIHRETHYLLKNCREVTSSVSMLCNSVPGGGSLQNSIHMSAGPKDVLENCNKTIIVIHLVCGFNVVGDRGMIHMNRYTVEGWLHTEKRTT